MTVCVQNIHYKTSPIPGLVRYLFIDVLGQYILIYRRPNLAESERKRKKKAWKNFLVIFFD
jgi:hypothetical protein